MVWNIYKMEMTLLFIKYKGAIMGNYTVFAEISTAIITLLRNVITPEPFNKPEQIGICSPREKENYEISNQCSNLGSKYFLLYVKRKSK